MTIKNRLKKLETKHAPGNTSLLPIFVEFDDEESEWAIVPGHGGELRKVDNESQGEFCQRAYHAYVEAKGLGNYRAEELSDEDLQCIVASSSSKLALKLYRNKELTDADIQSVILLTS